MPNLFKGIFYPTIADERGMFRYVVSVTATCVFFALTVDVINQLSFFVDWTTCLRSWTITFLLAFGLSAPISRTIGKAHLELFRAKQEAEILGRTDPLTGLPNRRALFDAVESKGSEILGLVIIDIDLFKRVNDAYGHHAGDVVIKSVGRVMADELGALGLVARIGGEEFALLSSSGSVDVVAAELDRFRQKIGNTAIRVGGSAVKVTISAGLAVRRQNETFDKLFSEADNALYVAKRSGRDRVCLAQTDVAAPGAPNAAPADPETDVRDAAPSPP